MSGTPRTLSEMRATCTKAARGAGCPWGLAEEAGLAVRLLAAHGLPGGETLADLLQTPRCCACGGVADAPACGLAEMAGLLDDMPTMETSRENVAAPLLLVAACLQDTQTGRSWRVAWEDGAISCGPEGIEATGMPAPRIAREITISRAEPPANATPSDWRSRVVADESWATLEDLAARTYVPETEASRAAGAGPGSGDAD